MNKKEFFKERIDKIAKESFNIEQKVIAKKIIDNTDDKDLDAVWGLISQRVKTGFVFDEAPEINHDCVAYIKENEKLGINVGKENNVEHSLIIGENYDALKNLVATYTDNQGNGLIDMIYIDPPYNTEKSKEEGNDYKEKIEAKKFVYRDKFTRDGWLNMMNERLKLAKILLADNGVIFISIDDSEQAYLKVLCDDIFGEENFITNFKWNRVAKAPSLSGAVRTKYEYIMAYYKKNHFKLFGKNSYNKQGPLWHLPNKRIKLVFPENSIRVKQSFEKKNYGGQYEVELMNDLICENGLNKNQVTICAHSAWGQKAIDEYVQKGFTFEIKKSPTTMYTDLDTDGNYVAPDDLIDFKNCGVKNNTDANSELTKMGIKFDYSKPVTLIKYLIKILEANNKKKLVLDFFAGSGTTGQAVMELNEEDGGNRKFILVTNNENDIATKITRERLYRVINGKGSKGEEFEWRYSKDKKNLLNNSLRVFDIFKENLNITDIDKAEKIKKEAEINFVKLNPNYKSKSDMDIYNVLASLTPYKNESED